MAASEAGRASSRMGSNVTGERASARRLPDVAGADEGPSPAVASARRVITAEADALRLMAHRIGADFAAVVDRLAAAGFDVEGDRVATRPRGVPADHPRLELMRARSLMVFRRFGAPDWLATPQAADEVRGAWREVRPLADWVGRHVAG